MRAVVIRGPGRPGLLGIEEVPIPPLGPGQVRVRVSAAALNFRDVHARRAAETNQPDPLARSPRSEPGLLAFALANGW